MLKKLTFIAIMFFSIALHTSEQFFAVFTEQLLQPYFTGKEAYTMMLVSRFHNAQQQCYHDKRIALHKEETKEGSTSLRKIAFNDLGVHPLYIVFDISGNGARGISNDGIKIIDFEVYPHYKLKGIVPIMPSTPSVNYANHQITCGITTTNHILGACLLAVTEKIMTPTNFGYILRNNTSPHIIIYFPTGKYQMFPNVDTRVGKSFLYGCYANNHTIDFYRETNVKQIAYKRHNEFACTDVKKAELFYSISIPGFALTADQKNTENALDDLHNYSPS